MMLFLGRDIRSNLLDIGSADGERAIATLPEEVAISRPLFLHPFRGRLLRLLNQARNGDGAGKITKNMNVILGAIDQDRIAPNLLQDARHIRVQPSAKFDVFEKRNAILCAEDDMQDDAGQGLRHGAWIVTPRGAFAHSLFHTQGGARASLALGWLAAGRWPEPDLEWQPQLQSCEQHVHIRRGDPALRIDLQTQLMPPSCETIKTARFGQFHKDESQTGVACPFARYRVP